MALGRPARPLEGRIAAVTGGARGIGRATAAALAAEGMRVAIGDLCVAHAQRTAEEIGPGAVGLTLDVTDRESFAAFVREAEGRLGPLDVLVNNAGIMPIGPFLQEPLSTQRGMVEINVHGVLLGMRLALPGMLARGRGHIVNIASTAGRVGFPNGAVYCGTKFFVYGASEAVRAELRGTGVEVSCVMPGYVRTELTSGLRESRLVRSVEPEDVGGAIVRALRRPRFDVYVPRSIGPSLKLGGLVPRRAREALGRALGADRFLVDYDHAGRHAYEQRAVETANEAEHADVR